MKIYNVGGSNRNFLMGIPANDEDFVVVGSSEEEMLALGYKKVGADFPVFLDDNGVEYALARTERKIGNGYNGFSTVFDSTVTLQEDLFRRDLQVNAIARDIETGQFIDPYNGQEDIKYKRLKHVSEAFREDPVRVLRLARFQATFSSDWVIDPSTLDLCQQMVDSGEMEHLTKERIWKEFEKALHTKNIELFLEVLEDCGALKVIFPYIHDNYALIQDMLFYNNDQYGADGRGIDKYFSPNFVGFANIFTHMEHYKFLKFCEEYKIPNDYRDYVLFFNKVERFNLNDDALDMIEYVDAIGLYRNNFIYNVPWRSPRTIRVNAIHCDSKDISFKNLSPQDQENLKGIEIKKAINKLRAERIKP